MISNRIYDDIPPQMKIFNIIPILMYFSTINIKNALYFMKHEHDERHITMTLITSDVAYDVGFPTVYRRIC